jgi:phosphate starvation-inducible protein PhoH
MSEAKIRLTDPAALLSLFGPQDQYLKVIRNHLGVAITHRDGKLKIMGEESAVRHATRLIENLHKRTQQTGKLTLQEVQAALSEIDAQRAVGSHPRLPPSDAAESLQPPGITTGPAFPLRAHRPEAEQSGVDTGERLKADPPMKTTDGWPENPVSSVLTGHDPPQKRQSAAAEPWTPATSEACHPAGPRPSDPRTPDAETRDSEVRETGGLPTPAARDVEVRLPHQKRTISPRSDGQTRFLAAIRGADLTLCRGPAGCGKTYLAVALAVEALKARKIRKIVLVRPAVEAGESLGFLPGDLQAKLNPYLRPLLDALNEMLDYDQVKYLMEHDVIEVIPLAYMRGRTLNEAFIILDEAQNTTSAQMKMFLTRMGEGSKIVVSGDVTQVDLPHGVNSGLRDAWQRLQGLHGVNFVSMDSGDIVRHRLVQEIVNRYESGQVVSRELGGQGKREDDSRR